MTTITTTVLLQAAQGIALPNFIEPGEKRSVPDDFDFHRRAKKQKGLSVEEMELPESDLGVSLICHETLDDLEAHIEPEVDSPLLQWKAKLAQKKQQLFCPFASNLNYSGEDWLYLLGTRDYSTTDKCIVRYLSELKDKESWKAIEETLVGDFFRQASKPLTETAKAFRGKYKSCFTKMNNGYSSIIKLCESCIKNSEEIALLKEKIKEQSLYVTKLQKIMHADFEQIAFLFQESGGKYPLIRAMRAQISDEKSTEVVFVDLLGENHLALSKNSPEFAPAVEIWETYKKFVESSLDEMQFFLQKNLTAIALMKPLYAEGLVCISQLPGAVDLRD